jgi:heme ABC exporter ATP-binding subunit CcmA
MPIWERGGRVSPEHTDEVASLEGAVCVRAGVPVLRGVHLRIHPGEIVLVTGANGAGKSTLLRALSGLLPLAAGSGQVLGHRLPDAAPAVRRAVAFVGHETRCYDDLSVRENLRFQAGTVGRGAVLAEEVAEHVGLSAVLDQPYTRLSAGQRRRCALATGLLRRSALLLLDEPHASLDVDGRALVDRIIREAAAEGGAVVLVSHEHASARLLADRELHVGDGSIRVVTDSNANTY